MIFYLDKEDILFVLENCSDELARVFEDLCLTSEFEEAPLGSQFTAIIVDSPIQTELAGFLTALYGENS